MHDILVGLVAANDRNNYGDILLPKIVERYAYVHHLNQLKFEYYSTSEQDLTYLGGNKTVEISKIPNSTRAIIISGGETLAVNYTSTYLYLQKNWLSVFAARFIRKVFKKRAENYFRKKLHGNSVMPWYIFPCNSGQLVFYDAVGGNDCNKLNADVTKELVNLTQKSTLFTVREKETYNNLKKIGCDKKVQLLPDTAIIMSRLFSIDDLINLASDETKAVLSTINTYYVIQINQDEGKLYTEILINAIKDIYRLYAVKCVLLPIGRAALHSDQLVLSSIHLNTKDETVLIQNNTIYDTMLLIAKAKCFIGTSLHGLITAMSYHVSHTAISNDIPKTIAFLKTWNTTKNIYVSDKNQIVNFYASSEHNNNINIENIEQAKNKVDEYFKYMFNLILHSSLG